MKMFMKLTVVVLSVFAASQAVAQDWMIPCPAGYKAYRSASGSKPLCIKNNLVGNSYAPVITKAPPARFGSNTNCFTLSNGQVECL